MDYDKIYEAIAQQLYENEKSNAEALKKLQAESDQLESHLEDIEVRRVHKNKLADNKQNHTQQDASNHLASTVNYSKQKLQQILNSEQSAERIMDGRLASLDTSDLPKSKRKNSDVADDYRTLIINAADDIAKLQQHLTWRTRELIELWEKQKARRGLFARLAVVGIIVLIVGTMFAISAFNAQQEELAQQAMATQAMNLTATQEARIQTQTASTATQAALDTAMAVVQTATQAPIDTATAMIENPIHTMTSEAYDIATATQRWFDINFYEDVLVWNGEGEDPYDQTFWYERQIQKNKEPHHLRSLSPRNQYTHRLLLETESESVRLCFRWAASIQLKHHEVEIRTLEGSAFQHSRKGWDWDYHYYDFVLPSLGLYEVRVSMAKDRQNGEDYYGYSLVAQTGQASQIGCE